MYVPSPNRMDDRAEQVAFMRQYSFATLVTADSGAAPRATHLPFVVVEEGAGLRLVAHLASLGLADGMRVDLISEFTDAAGNLEERRAKDFLVVPYSTPVGNVASYYPETNALVPLDHTAVKSNTPVSKAVVVRLEHADG